MKKTQLLSVSLILIALFSMGSGALAASAGNAANSGLFTDPILANGNKLSTLDILGNAGTNSSMINAANVPTPISPGGTISDKTPTYRWSVVAGAAKYKLQVYQGTAKVFEKEYTSGVCSSSTCSGTPTNTLGNKNYKWQVRAYLGGSWYPWSAWKSFSVAGSFNSQFTSNAADWTVHRGVWEIQSGTYTTVGVSNQSASVSYNASYTTLTYEARLKRISCSSCADYSNRIMIRGTPAVTSDGDWKNAYMFQYSNDGQFSVWKNYMGTSTALKYWTLHGAINCDGWNILKVTANGSDIKFWINGTLVWEGTDPDLSSGRVGIGMFRDNATGNRLRVDWAKLTITVADSDELDVLVPGVEVAGGNVDRSSRIGWEEIK